MAWILRNSGNGHAYEAMERVVAKKNTNVYLEAMEVTENKGGKPEEIGHARLAGLPKRKHSKRLLAVAGSGILHHTITNERLARRGYYDISEAYKSMHSI